MLLRTVVAIGATVSVTVAVPIKSFVADGPLAAAADGPDTFLDMGDTDHQGPLDSLMLDGILSVNVDDDRVVGETDVLLASADADVVEPLEGVAALEEPTRQTTLLGTAPVSLVPSEDAVAAPAAEGRLAGEQAMLDLGHVRRQGALETLLLDSSLSVVVGDPDLLEDGANDVLASCCCCGSDAKCGCCSNAHDDGGKMVNDAMVIRVPKTLEDKMLKRAVEYEVATAHPSSQTLRTANAEYQALENTMMKQRADTSAQMLRAKLDMMALDQERKSEVSAKEFEVNDLIHVLHGEGKSMAKLTKKYKKAKRSRRRRRRKVRMSKGTVLSRAKKIPFRMTFKNNFRKSKRLRKWKDTIVKHLRGFHSDLFNTLPEKQTPDDNTLPEAPRVKGNRLPAPAKPSKEKDNQLPEASKDKPAAASFEKGEVDSMLFNPLEQCRYCIMATHQIASNGLPGAKGMMSWCAKTQTINGLLCQDVLVAVGRSYAAYTKQIYDETRLFHRNYSFLAYKLDVCKNMCQLDDKTTEPVEKAETASSDENEEEQTSGDESSDDGSVEETIEQLKPVGE